MTAYRVAVQKESGARQLFRVTDNDLAMMAKRKKATRLAARLKTVAQLMPSNAAAYGEAVKERDYLNGFTRLRHAYALTVHKSQGSTFDTVFMDWGDIASARDAKMHYVAVTRAADCLVVAA